MLTPAALDSWLSRRDDRARVLALVGLAGALSALQTLAGVGVALGLAGVLALSLGLGPRRLLRRFWPLLALLLPLALLTPFWHPPQAEPLLAGWPWGPTDLGLRATGVVCGRVLAIALVAVGGLEAAPFDRTARALQELKVPRALVHLALLTYRYLFLFVGDLRRVRAALSARAFRPGPNLSTLQTLGGVTGGMLVRSLARTERVEQAMRCRGYTGQLQTGPAPPAGWRDLLLLLVALGLAAGVLSFDLLQRGLR